MAQRIALCSTSNQGTLPDSINISENIVLLKLCSRNQTKVHIGNSSQYYMYLDEQKYLGNIEIGTLISISQGQRKTIDTIHAPTNISYNLNLT